MARARRAVLPVTTGLLLLLAVLLPVTEPRMTGFVASAQRHVHAAGAVGLAGLAALVALAAVAQLVRLARRRWSLRDAGRPLVQLTLHLWPVALLTIIYPIATHRMTGHSVGGVPLPTFLLASSLTVPWVSQGVCMPLYRALGPLMQSGDKVAIREQFCAAWPVTFLRTLPILGVFALPLALLLHWSLTALTAYMVLVSLDVAFAQFLVLANLGRARVGWAFAWTGYALPLLIVPWAWFLPPLLGLLTQLLPLGRSLRTRPIILPRGEVARDVVRGLLLGAVLWADKLIYFLRADGTFAVSTVFLALLPAILAYNYYFVRMAPKFDIAVARLRVAMESQPLEQLAHASRALAHRVELSVRRTALVGAALVLAIAWALSAASPHLVALVASVSVASWLFTMITVVCYKLDYIGEKVAAQVISGAHLALALAAFLVLPLGATLYFSLAGADLVLLGAALAVCLRAWRTPEYTFFWRHALAW